MNNSLKAGIISGLFAGIVLGTAYDITTRIAFSLDLFESWWRPIISNITVVNIPLFSFWGIILGVIYSSIYTLIPKKGIWKGLIYGLFLYFIVTIRIEFFSIAYSLFLNAAGHFFTGFFSWLSYGLVLGILYKYLCNRYNVSKEEKKIVQYDMMSGLLPGAIAGFSGGLAASVFAVIGQVTGYWGTIIAGEIISTLDFWMSQAGTHILINMIWGTIFALFFPKVYNLIPGKKILKGLYYGLVMFLITTFNLTTWLIIWYANHNLWELAFKEILGLSVGSANAIVFGLVLGLLYRKPPK